MIRNINILITGMYIGDLPKHLRNIIYLNI